MKNERYHATPPPKSIKHQASSIKHQAFISNPPISSHPLILHTAPSKIHYRPPPFCIVHFAFGEQSF
jgi:hypothetical protein